MIIKGMEHFQNVCKNRLVDWYNLHSCPGQPHIDVDDVFVVWSCKTLQNYKALLSTTVIGDGIYAEYTYNGDKQELYEDVYRKLTNTCIKEEGKDSIKESLKKEEVLMKNEFYIDGCKVVDDDNNEYVLVDPMETMRLGNLVLAKTVTNEWLVVGEVVKTINVDEKILEDF